MPAAYLKAPGGVSSVRPVCRKSGYVSRKAAQRALKAQQMGGANGLRIYKCPFCENVWHLGHPPRSK